MMEVVPVTGAPAIFAASGMTGVPALLGT